MARAGGGQGAAQGPFLAGAPPPPGQSGGVVVSATCIGATRTAVPVLSNTRPASVGAEPGEALDMRDDGWEALKGRCTNDVHASRTACLCVLRGPCPAQDS